MIYYILISFSIRFFLPLESACQILPAQTLEILTLADSLFASHQYYDAVTEYKRFNYLSTNHHYRDYALGKIGLSFDAIDDSVQAYTFINQSIQFTETVDLRDLRRETYALILAKDGKYLYALSQLDSVKIQSYNTFYYRGLIHLCLLDSIACKSAINYLTESGDSIIHNKKELLQSLLMELQSMPLKDVRKANRLSSVLPGSGQIYGGKVGDGVNAFLLNTLLAYLVVRNIVVENYLAALGTGLLFSKFYLRNKENAVIISQQYNEKIITMFINKVRSIFQQEFKSQNAWYR